MKTFLISFLLSITILTFLTTPVFARLDNLEPEIVYPQSSNVCAEFPIEVKTSSENPLGANPAPPGGSSTSKDSASGDLTLDKDKFPDFEQMKKDMEKAVRWLTPKELLDIYSVSGPSLETKAKHFVMGKDDNGLLIAPEKEKIPETKITQPDWFTGLLGSTRWVCGIFGTCPAAKSPVIKIQQANVKISDEAYNNLCLIETPKIPEQEAGEEALQTQFTVLSLWDKFVETFERIIDFIISIFVRETKETQLVVRTQSDLAGGGNFAAYSDFQRASIPQSFMEEFEIKTGSLATKENDYTIRVQSQTGNYQKPINYSDKVKEQFKRCISLCSIYPAEFDISSIDPICPSCDPKDYDLEYIPVDKTNCHPQPGGGCDYKNDAASPSCEGDPICESGKCYPNMYRMINDYTSQGCTPPYPGGGCTVPELCKSMNFKKNPAGGFGPCQYLNQNVCVRADWIQGGIGRCDYLCNWACCAYQK